MSFRYYEGRLAGAEREAYRAIRISLQSCAKSFSAPRIDTRRLGEIFNMIKLDDPFIFHADALSFRAPAEASHVTVTPRYSMKKQEYEATKATVEKRISRIMADAEGLSPLKAEKYIHDYIIKNVRYDKLKKAYSHEVTGSLCHGIGVCEGMSKTFKLLCDASGIECIVATGIGVPPESATGKREERHAWNIVIFGERAAGVDVTFDRALTAEGRIRYDFFNVPDEIMNICHGSTDYPVPRCRGFTKHQEE